MKAYEKLANNPSGYNAFDTKRMNFLVDSLEDSVASWEEIMATNRPFFELKSKPIGSLDFGSVRDFTSCGLLFKKGDEFSFKTFRDLAELNEEVRVIEGADNREMIRTMKDVLKKFEDVEYEGQEPETYDYLCDQFKIDEETEGPKERAAKDENNNNGN